MRDRQATLPSTDLPRATLSVLIIVVLIALTLWILRPFLGAIIWASMIVVSTWPVMRQLQVWLWGSRKLAVATMTGTLLLVLVLPLSLAIGAIVSNAGEIIDWAARLRSFPIPGPPAWLGTLPVVGGPAVEAWQKIAASRLADVASAAAPYAATAILWTASTLRGVGWLLVQFLLTLAIAAVMYAKGERAADGALRFGRQLAGEAGDRVVRLAAQAIRGVALGVVVTAAVQSALAGIGLAVAGVPFAALLAAVAFILCIAQLGPALVLAPAVGWLYLAGRRRRSDRPAALDAHGRHARQLPAPVPDDQGSQSANAADVRRRDGRPAGVRSDRHLRRSGGARGELHAPWGLDRRPATRSPRKRRSMTPRLVGSTL